MNKLKTYLTLNSAFSAISGLTMLLFSESLNHLFNLSNAYVFPVIGVNLLIFSALVWYVSRKHLTNALLVNIISLLDLLWVIGSAVIVLFGLFDISKQGNVLIVVVAIWIAFLAFMQYQNNKIAS